MGKAVSTAFKIAATIATPFFPAAGLALAATAAVSDIHVADRARSKANTEADRNLRAQEAEMLNQLERDLQQKLNELNQACSEQEGILNQEQQEKLQEYQQHLSELHKIYNIHKQNLEDAAIKEQLALQRNLEELRKIYEQEYGALTNSKELMEEYYLLLKNSLEQEQIIINNLPEVLEILDICARGNGHTIIERVIKFKQEIMILLNWGLMHVAMLANDRDLYREIFKLSSSTIDCLQLDHLGHSILEYAHLLGDRQLIIDLKASKVKLELKKVNKAARILLADNKITWIAPDNREPCGLLAYLNPEQQDIANALMAVGAVPDDQIKCKELIKKLFFLEQLSLLEQFLILRSGNITLELIQELEQSFPELNYKQERSIDALKAFLWLNIHGFTNINQLHPETNETPLEMIMHKGSRSDFETLMYCKPDVQYINAQGENIVMVAIRNKQFERAEYLIELYQLEPRSYNHEYHTAVTVLPNYNDGYYTRRITQKLLKQSQVTDAAYRSTTVNRISNDFLRQAGNLYNLWRQGRRAAKQIRTPVVLGLYVLGLRQLLPWDEHELPWLANELQLKVQYLPELTQLNDITTAKDCIYVTKTTKGYKAIWGINKNFSQIDYDNINDSILEIFPEFNSLDVVEPDIQYCCPETTDLALTFDNADPCATVKDYVNSNYALVKRFFSSRQSWWQALEAWKRDIQYESLRRDEVAGNTPIEVSNQPVFTTSGDQYSVYKMPECDAGYQALGLSRLTVAKLLIDHLDQPEILKCIKVEWINWLITLSYLPKDLNDIKGLLTALTNYHNAKVLLEQEADNLDDNKELEHKLADLYQFATKEQCAAYIGKVIASPHNQLNSLKYYPAKYALPAGGVLVALAKITKRNVRVWRQQLAEIDCIFEYKAADAWHTLDLWQISLLDNSLDQVAVLSKNQNLQLKPVLTHAELFATLEVDSDLAAIVHGWFLGVTHFAGITPQNDLLALLLQVKAKIGHQLSEDMNLLQQINYYRYKLSNELSTKFGEQFYNLQALDQKWAKTADLRIRNWTRERLLQEHCLLIEDYKANIDLLQSKLMVDVEHKLANVAEQNDNFLKQFKQELLDLEQSHQQQEQLFQEQHIKDQQIIQEEVLRLEQFLFEQEQLVEQGKQQNMRFIADLRKEVQQYKAEQENQLQALATQNRRVIHDAINSHLADVHAQIKKNYRKNLRGIISNFAVNTVATIVMPVPDKISLAMAKGFAMNAARTTLSGEKFNFKYALAEGVQQVVAKLTAEVKIANIPQAVLVGMAGNFVIGLLIDKHGNELLRRTMLGGLQGLCNYGIQHHFKISNEYAMAVFRGSCDGILEGIKNKQTKLDQLLISASNSIANNLYALKAEKLKTAIMQEQMQTKKQSTAKFSIPNNQRSKPNQAPKSPKRFINDSALYEAAKKQKCGQENYPILDKYGLLESEAASYRQLELEDQTLRYFAMAEWYHRNQQQELRSASFFEVLGKAVNGNYHAQQEMRRRYPGWAAASDESNSEANTRIMRRAEGAGQFVFGLAQIPVPYVGFPMAANNISAGLIQIITGQKESTAFGHALKAAGKYTGLYGEETANNIELGMNMITGFGGLTKVIRNLKGLDLAKASVSAKNSAGLSSSLAKTTKNFSSSNQARFASNLTPATGKTVSLSGTQQTLANCTKALLPVGLGIFGVNAVMETNKFVGQGRCHSQGDALGNKKSPATSDIPSSSSQFSGSAFVAHLPRPNIFVTPPAEQLPNLPGLVPPTIGTGTRTEFPGKPIELSVPPPSIFVPSDPLPENAGVPDLSGELNRPRALLFSKKKDSTNIARPHAPSSGHVPVPKIFKVSPGTLPGFPGSKYDGRTNCKRDRWVLKNKTFATWDKRHGAVDLFTKTGKEHLGKYDPYTGKQLKEAKPERTSKPS